MLRRPLESVSPDVTSICIVPAEWIGPRHVRIQQVKNKTRKGRNAGKQCNECNDQADTSKSIVTVRKKGAVRDREAVPLCIIETSLVAIVRIPCLAIHGSPVPKRTSAHFELAEKVMDVIGNKRQFMSSWPCELVLYVCTVCMC